MSYQDEFNRLQRIIVADGSTPDQRTAARAAQTILIDNRIEEAFKRFENRTQEFNTLVGQLKGVVDKISANQLTGALDTLNNVLGDVQKAAEENDPRPTRG